MEQVVIEGEKKVVLKDVSIPKVKEDWVLVKIFITPMCTEFKQYSSGSEIYPLGHEAVGEIVEVSSNNGAHIGDKVVVMPQYSCGKCEMCLKGDYIYCQSNYNFEEFTGSLYGASTYAQYILKPYRLLPKIPEDITFKHASLLCCGLGPTFGAMEKMKVISSDIILITGLGPVGLGGVINAVSKGSRVIGITKNEYRANLALELGALNVFNPQDPEIKNQIINLTNGKGANIGLDCAGTAAAQKLLIDLVKPGGKISFIGESNDLNIKVSDQLIRKGLTLYGVWHYNLNLIKKLFQLVRKHKSLLEKMITHSFSLRDVKDAWELQLTKKCGKVILYPWENNFNY